MRRGTYPEIAGFIPQANGSSHHGGDAAVEGHDDPEETGTQGLVEGRTGADISLKA
jgi:hypothetical protein